ncbi:protein kinase [Theileria orientalis strain Shintoku]|uniref:Serine/threonine-protein kinase RIO1 n=1 Tax=Theileria orientalis strain Shintoku TaxID=869250 RepID=J4C2V9_THEOR|nr:protein kinase [Theileria orientalis strain Shintoku]BAM39371.1 protein kinase [Theileria orientalis strain Shintoku]|eukprot:XP_009689672.1 protein kinase [Theileria orientalis strain Shintoku]
MSYTDSIVFSESEHEPEPESGTETEENTSSVLFFKKAPNDESRLARNSIIYKKNNIEKGLTKDKRVTVQQVLDKRTYVRLKRLHGRGIFDFIYGVISTGKEANVYEAEGTLLSQKHRIAIKVYKTSILIFKDRSRYIEGEFRFRRSYVGTKNPRKMVSQWAEKEFRNLRRISLSGLCCPAPIALKDHILIMELVQDSEGLVASKLKDLGSLPLEEWMSIYAQVISIMRILYQEPKLIHADFSEYNLLYTDSKVIVIDVSQAVENDHPNAMYFLKRDCENITTFFTTIQCHIANHMPKDGENKEEDEAEDTTQINETHGDKGNSHGEEADDPEIVEVGVGEAKATKMEVDEEIKFNMLTSYQLFNFITMDMEVDMNANVNREIEMEIEKLNTNELKEEEEVDWYVNKMVFTSKNAKFEHLKETIIKKRRYYNGLCRYVEKLLNERNPSIFVSEKYETRNFISHEATWNSLKLINISGLTVDVLDRLEREKSLPEIKITRKKMVETKTDGEESDVNEMEAFDGKIPEGIPAKDWKKMVKEMNRERRKHKIPKHIKKSFKHKHVQNLHVWGGGVGAMCCGNKST